MILAIWSIQNGLDCNTCTEQLKQFRGHDSSERRVVEGVEVDKCPMLYVGEIERLQLEAYRQYKSGFLPGAGGWLDQPMKFGQVVGFIDGVVSDLNEKEEHGNQRAQYTSNARR